MRNVNLSMLAAIVALSEPMRGYPGACNGHARSLPNESLGLRSYAEPPKKPAEKVEPAKCSLTLKQRKKLLAHKMRKAKR